MYVTFEVEILQFRYNKSGTRLKTVFWSTSRFTAPAVLLWTSNSYLRSTWAYHDALQWTRAVRGGHAVARTVHAHARRHHRSTFFVYVRVRGSVCGSSVRWKREVGALFFFITAMKKYPGIYGQENILSSFSFVVFFLFSSMIFRE